MEKDEQIQCRWINGGASFHRSSHILTRLGLKMILQTEFKRWREKNVERSVCPLDDICNTLTCFLKPFVAVAVQAVGLKVCSENSLNLGYIVLFQDYIRLLFATYLIRIVTLFQVQRLQKILPPENPYEPLRGILNLSFSQ